MTKSIIRKRNQIISVLDTSKYFIKKRRSNNYLLPIISQKTQSNHGEHYSTVSSQIYLKEKSLKLVRPFGQYIIPPQVDRKCRYTMFRCLIESWFAYTISGSRKRRLCEAKLSCVSCPWSEVNQ